jgi:hypothetical protein
MTLAIVRTAFSLDEPNVLVHAEVLSGDAAVAFRAAVKLEGLTPIVMRK